MPLLFQRQLPTPSGLTTVPVFASGTALNTDTVDTGTFTGLSAPTLTFSTIVSQTPSLVSSVPSFSPVATAGGSGGGSSLNTPTIIGLIIGIFVLLAAALIVFMTIRHRKRRQKSVQARTLSSARKSWSRLREESRKPTAAEMQMRSTGVAKTVPVAKDSGPPTGHSPFLTLNPTDPVVWDDPFASVPDNPTHQQSSRSERSYVHPFAAAVPDSPTHQQSSRSERSYAHSQAVHSESHGRHESRIPNPFSSPPLSPSSFHSSHTSTCSTNAHSVSFTPSTNFVQYLPEYPYAHAHNTSIGTTSSISEYPDELPVRMYGLPAHPKVGIRKGEFPESVRVPGKRTRERKAMQDLISALDERGQNKKEADAPSSFNFSLDTSMIRGSSRLSMGEGLVTPGGHSLREGDAVAKSNHDGNAHWTSAHMSTDGEQGYIPLLLPNVSRAPINPGKGQEKSHKLQNGKKGTGNGAPPNSSRD